LEFGGGLDTGKEISHGSKTLYKDHLALHLCAHKKNERTEYHAGAYPGGYTHTHYVHQRGMLRYTSVYTHTVLSTHTTQPVNKRKRAPLCLSDEKTAATNLGLTVANLSLLKDLSFLRCTHIHTNPNPNVGGWLGPDVGREQCRLRRKVGWG